MKDLIKQVQAKHHYEVFSKTQVHRLARQLSKKLLKKELMEEEKRRCPNCGITQNLTEFSPDPTRFGWCNTCHNYWIEERYI